MRTEGEQFVLAYRDFYTICFILHLSSFIFHPSSFILWSLNAYIQAYFATGSDRTSASAFGGVGLSKST